MSSTHSPLDHAVCVWLISLNTNPLSSSTFSQKEMAGFSSFLRLNNKTLQPIGSIYFQALAHLGVTQSSRALSGWQEGQTAGTLQRLRTNTS